jgi:hypothetical protein
MYVSVLVTGVKREVAHLLPCGEAVNFAATLLTYTILKEVFLPNRVSTLSKRQFLTITLALYYNQ